MVNHKIILGTVQLGLDYGINNKLGKPSLEQSKKILDTAYNIGIQYLDTAEAYGSSQKIIGLFHKENPQKHFNVITKISSDSKIDSNQLKNNVGKNIEILNVDFLYGYMFHSYNHLIGATKIFEKLQRIKEEGLIRKIGISLYSNHEIEDIITRFEGFDFIQIPFNLLDNDYQRKKIIQKVRKKGIEIHTRSVFLQGLFFKDINAFPDKLKPLTPYLNTLNQLKKSHDFKTESLALQYVIQKEYIDHVLIGVDSEEQLIKNMNAIHSQMSLPNKIIDNIAVSDINLLNPTNWL